MYRNCYQNRSYDPQKDCAWINVASINRPHDASCVIKAGSIEEIRIKTTFFPRKLGMEQNREDNGVFQDNASRSIRSRHSENVAYFIPVEQENKYGIPETWKSKSGSRKAKQRRLQLKIIAQSQSRLIDKTRSMSSFRWHTISANGAGWQIPSYHNNSALIRRLTGLLLVPATVCPFIHHAERGHSSIEYASFACLLPYLYCYQKGR